MFKLLRLIVLVGVIAVGAIGFVRLLPDSPPLPEGAKADKILVLKGERKLVLLKRDIPLKTYEVALGWSPEGHKVQEGDGKTPEGDYLIDWRKPDSSFHRALHISYPNAADKDHARKLGVSPGGAIMIHGMRNGAGWIGKLHRFADWTNGCIAVTDPEIREIWRAVPNGTPIEIRP
ncbi:MAG: L,D-transpeptidase family protein [Pseudomonadota bacterium]